MLVIMLPLVRSQAIHCCGEAPSWCTGEVLGTGSWMVVGSSRVSLSVPCSTVRGSTFAFKLRLECGVPKVCEPEISIAAGIGRKRQTQQNPQHLELLRARVKGALLVCKEPRASKVAGRVSAWNSPSWEVLQCGAWKLWIPLSDFGRISAFIKMLQLCFNASPTAWHVPSCSIPS